MHEIGYRFSAYDASEGGEYNGHCEFDAGEDVGRDDRVGDVCGIGFHDEEEAGEAYDGDPTFTYR